MDFTLPPEADDAWLERQRVQQQKWDAIVAQVQDMGRAYGKRFPPRPEHITPTVPTSRRIGMTAMVGGKNKTKIRNATPIQFRDVLIGIATTAQRRHVAA